MDRDVRACVLGDSGVVADVVPVSMARNDQLQGPAAFGERVRYERE